MVESSLGRVLEIFFGGNTAVDAAILFDTSGETIDYHSYIDPFDARLIAAHCGILFEQANYKMKWLAEAMLEIVEIHTSKMDMVISMVCEEYLIVIVINGTPDDNLFDAIAGSIEVLRKEIGC